MAKISTPLASCCISLNLFVHLCVAISHNQTSPRLRADKLKGMADALNESIHGFNYNFKDVPPDDNNVVECFVSINKITAIKETAQTFSLDVYLHTNWTDYRLNHTNITDEFIIPDKYLNKIWIPDVDFLNSLDGLVHRVTDKSLNVIVGRGGTVRMTTWVAVELSCPMNFTFYPMDTQLCKLQLQSWRYNEQDLLLAWRDGGFSVKEDLTTSLPRYSLHISTSEEIYRRQGDNSYRCVETYSSAGQGSYSCLELNFSLRRQLSFFALDIYIPSTLIVLVSFISLFIDHRVVPARITIGSLSMTATTNIVRTFKQNSPAVSYLKASDVWIWACQAFVFAVFLEFGFVNYISRKFVSFTKNKDTFLMRSHPGKLLDKLARICFPAGFILFIAIYWAYYIERSQYTLSITDIIDDLMEYNTIGREGPIPG